MNSHKSLIASYLVVAPVLISCVLQAAEATAPAIVEANIVLGEDLQICRDVAAVLEEKRAPVIGHCGLPVPIDNADYKLIDWVALDPMENIELIRIIYYWANLSVNAGQDAYNDQYEDRRSIDQSLLDLYWSRAEAKMLALVEERKIELQHARFDIDNDGEDEDVYRTTPAGRVRTAIPPQEDEIHDISIGGICENYGLPDADRDYTYYVPPEQLEGTRATLADSWPGSMDGFVKWRDRTYWISAGNVMEPETLTVIGERRIIRTKQVCSVLTTNNGADQ